MRYILDGLCHQTANRILRSASLRVEAARGYKISFNLYGHYGLGGWRWADCCIACDAEHLLEADATLEQPPGLEEAEVDYVPERNDRDDYIRGCVERFELLVSAQPEQIAPTVVQQAEQALADMAARQFDLKVSFERRSLAADDFYGAFIETTKDGYATVERVLGRERFIRVFGVPPDVIGGLFDPDAYGRTHQPGS